MKKNGRTGRKMAAEEIASACGGRILAGDKTQTVRRIVLDSRKAGEGDLFVPIIGERVDAHRFLDQVSAAGAAAVFTSEHGEGDISTGAGEKTAWIQVEDTRAALQRLGARCRAKLSIPVIGVTGSVGKTTTREMIAAALNAGFQVYKTPGNSNSQVGVPITMWDIAPEDEIAVIELGMSEPGELTRIAKIARPTMAVITNIGIAHIEQLGSQENILREKLTIQDGLEPGGLLLLNGDDDLLRTVRAREGFRTIYYGTGEHCQYRAENVTMENGRAVFTAVHGSRRVPVRLQVPGLHNVQNAIAALAVAEESGLPMEQAVRTLEKFHGFKHRQQIFEKNGVIVVDDTYNASPVSMKAGLDILASVGAGKRRIAVLADMKELGEDTRQFHYEVGAYMKEHPVELLFTLGELAEEIARGAGENGGAGRIERFLEKKELGRRLKEILRPGDCVLFKGSNSMGLSELAEQFYDPEAEE